MKKETRKLTRTDFKLVVFLTLVIAMLIWSVLTHVVLDEALKEAGIQAGSWDRFIYGCVPWLVSLELAVFQCVSLFLFLALLVVSWLIVWLTRVE